MQYVFYGSLQNKISSSCRPLTGLQGAPQSSPCDLLLISHEWFKVNFAVFFVERLCEPICAKFHLVTANKVMLNKVRISKDFEHLILN